MDIMFLFYRRYERSPVRNLFGFHEGFDNGLGSGPERDNFVFVDAGHFFGRHNADNNDVVAYALKVLGHPLKRVIR